jgi:hypothetical protein
MLDQNNIPVEMVTRLMGSKYSKDLEHDAPSYEELRDMFSEGQMASKLWLAYNLNEWLEDEASFLQKAAIVGSWFGTLAAILQLTDLHRLRYTLVDIDPRCQRVLDAVEPFPIPSLVDPVTDNMYGFDYSEYNIVINTSCEHVHSLEEFIAPMEDNTRIVLQSNNFIGGHNHINCVNSADELADYAKESGMREIVVQGTLKCYAYDRYMVMGYR